MALEAAPEKKPYLDTVRSIGFLAISVGGSAVLSKGHYYHQLLVVRFRLRSHMPEHSARHQHLDGSHIDYLHSCQITLAFILRPRAPIGGMDIQPSSRFSLVETVEASPPSTFLLITFLSLWAGLTLRQLPTQLTRVSHWTVLAGRRPSQYWCSLHAALQPGTSDTSYPSGCHRIGSQCDRQVVDLHFGIG